MLCLCGDPPEKVPLRGAQTAFVCATGACLFNQTSRSLSPEITQNPAEATALEASNTFRSWQRQMEASFTRDSLDAARDAKCLLRPQHLALMNLLHLSYERPYEVHRRQFAHLFCGAGKT